MVSCLLTPVRNMLSSLHIYFFLYRTRCLKFYMGHIQCTLRWCSIIRSMLRAVNEENRRSCERSRPLRSSSIRESSATTSRGSRVRHQAGRSSTTNTTTTCSQRWGARLSRTHRPQGSDVYWIHPATPVQSLSTPSATQAFRPVSAYPPAANANWRPQTIRCSVNRVIQTQMSVHRYLAETPRTWRTRSTSSFKIRRRWSVKETAIVARGWRRLMNSARQTITAVQGVLIEQAQVVMRRRHYPGGKVTLDTSSGLATSNGPSVCRACCCTYRCSCVSERVWEIGCGQTRSIVTANTCWTSLIRSCLPSTTSMNVVSCTVISRYVIIYVLKYIFVFDCTLYWIITHNVHFFYMLSGVYWYSLVLTLKALPNQWVALKNVILPSSRSRMLTSTGSFALMCACISDFVCLWESGSIFNTVLLYMPILSAYHMAIHRDLNVWSGIRWWMGEADSVVTHVLFATWVPFVHKLLVLNSLLHFRILIPHYFMEYLWVVTSASRISGRLSLIGWIRTLWDHVVLRLHWEFSLKFNLFK